MDDQALRNITMACNKAGLTAGTTTTLTTANQIDYSIQGKAYRIAAQTNLATPTTDAVTGNAFTAISHSTPANGNGSVFVIGFDDAGALKVAQGTVQALDASGKFILSPQFPGIPGKYVAATGLPALKFCPIGYLVVKVGPTASDWTFGTSNLTGPPTGVTLTWVDCLTLPDRPQVQ